MSLGETGGGDTSSPIRQGDKLITRPWGGGGQTCN